MYFSIKQIEDVCHPPLAGGGRVWDFFSIWRRLKVNIYHRSSSFDFHSRLSSYASYTEIRVCFLFKVSRDCFRTPTSHTMLLPCVENVGILQLFSIISRSLKYLLFSNQNFTSKVFLSFFRPHKSSHWWFASQKRESLLYWGVDNENSKNNVTLFCLCIRKFFDLFSTPEAIHTREKGFGKQQQQQQISFERKGDLVRNANIIFLFELLCNGSKT